MRVSVVWIARFLLSLLLMLERPAEALRRGHLTAEMVTQIRNRWAKLEKHALDPKKRDRAQQIMRLAQDFPLGGMIPAPTKGLLDPGDAALVRGTAYLSENKVRALKRQMKRLEERLKNPKTKAASQLLIDLTIKYPHGGIIPWSIYDRAVWFLKGDGSQTVSSNPSQNHLLDILLGQRKPTKRLRSEAHQAQ